MLKTYYCLNTCPYKHGLLISCFIVDQAHRMNIYENMNISQQTFVLMKMSWRRLDQDEYVRPSLTSSEDVLVKTNILVLAIHLEDVLQRYLQDVFKTHYQVKLFLLTCLWEAFDTFLRRSFPKTVIYSRGICLGNTTSDKFMVSV